MIVDWGLRVGLGSILVRASIPKLLHPKRFVVRVLAYRVLSFRASRLYALLLPPVELMVGLLLVLGVSVRVAALVSAALISSFVWGIGVNLLRGRRIECGCFGARRTIGWPLVAQDVGLLAASLELAWTSDGWLHPALWSAARLTGVSGAGSAVVAGACAVVVVLITSWSYGPAKLAVGQVRRTAGRRRLGAPQSPLER
jgi:hypothetical protein